MNIARSLPAGLEPSGQEVQMKRSKRWIPLCALALAAAMPAAHATGTILINANGMIACPTIEGAHLVAQAKEAYGQGDIGAQNNLIGKARAQHCNKIEAGEVKTVDITGIDVAAGVMRLAVTFGQRVDGVVRSDPRAERQSGLVR
jgi:hypothetical protein